MRKFFFFFLFCAALGLLAITYKVQLVERIALFGLSKANFDQVVCDVASLSSRSFSLNTLSARKNFHGKSYSFTLHDATLFFTLDGLRQKKLEKIAIKEAIITLPGKKKPLPEKKLNLPKEEELADTLNILDTLSLPVESIVIDKLILKNGPLAFINNTPITLLLNTKDDLLEGRAKVALDQGKIALVKVERTPEKTYRGALQLISDVSKHKPLELELTRQHLKGAGTIDLQRIAQDFPQLGIPQGYTGVATYGFSAKVADPPALHIRSSFTNLVTDKVAVQDGTLDIEMEVKDLSYIAITDRSFLSLNGVRTQAAIDSLKMGLGGTVILSPKEVQIEPTSTKPWLISSISMGANKIKELEFFPPTVIREKGSIKLVPAPAQSIRFQGVRAGALHIPSLDLSPVTSTPIHIQTAENGVVTLSSPPWKTKQVTLEKGKQHIIAEHLQLTTKEVVVHPKGIAVDCNLESSNLTLHQPPYSLPLANINGAITLEDQRVQARIETEFPFLAGHLKLDAEHNLKLGKGKAQLTSTEPIVFTPDNGIESLVQELKLPVKFSGGQLHLNSKMEWQHKQPPQVEVKTHLAQAVGSGANFTFTGAELNQHLKLLPEMQSITPGKLSIEHIQGPVLIQGLESNFVLGPSGKGIKPSIDVQQFNFNLLDGVVRTQPFIFDPNTSDHLITVEADHIDLSAVAELFKVKGLQVDGTMSGSIPLYVEGKTISVNGGALAGDEQGGTIRYKIEGLAEQQSQLTAYALKALEEFHFSVLRAPVTYHPDGTLLVDLHLQGTSPALSTTRPVHLNVHTDQNLLSLLKSLRYNAVFTEELNSRLQNKAQSP